MLTLAEELVLLVLDDKDGTMLPIPQRSFDFALSGAVLMDLALRRKIDTDPEKIWICDTHPTGEPFLDAYLSELQMEDTKSDRIGEWIEFLAHQPSRIQEAALARLVARGVLRREDRRFFWVFETRRYPVIDDKEEREVKLRIMSVLFSEEIPDPRDVALICLVDACHLVEEILGAREAASVRGRIAVVRKLDLIGQVTQSTVREIERAVSQIQPFLH